jgi:pyridoxamine 5'-phosphate oxidase
VAAPAAATFATADAEGRPSARTVTLKRIADGALLFSSALWTRKVREIEDNPHVALVFYWPELGRQAQVAGVVAAGSRALAEELWTEAPDRLHDRRLFERADGAWTVRLLSP